MIRELNPGDVLFLLKALQWTILLSIVAFAGGAVCGRALWRFCSHLHALFMIETPF